MKSPMLVVIAAFASLASAEEPQQAKKPMTREQAEQIEALEAAQDSLKELMQAVDGITRERRFACIKAFGHRAFCECLNENMAVGVSFDDYIVAITRTDEQLSYSSLPDDKRTLIDSARRTREQCVKVL